MENTFWTTNRDVKFMDLFKSSFTQYSIKSGKRVKMEAAIDILVNECPVTKDSDFKEEFHKVIIEHYLRKFH